MSRRKLELLLHYLIIAIFLVWILYPMLGVLELALLRNGADLTGIVVPQHITFTTFTRAWNFAQFGTALENSAIVAGSVTVSCVLLSTLAGYAFGKMRFAGSRILFYVSFWVWSSRWRPISSRSTSSSETSDSSTRASG